LETAVRDEVDLFLPVISQLNQNNSAWDIRKPLSGKSRKGSGKACYGFQENVFPLCAGGAPDIGRACNPGEMMASCPALKGCQSVSRLSPFQDLVFAGSLPVALP
jgi:hypothetical protein